MFAILTLSLCVGAEFVIGERTFANKIALVTGAARGIGFSVVNNFLKSGVNFIIIVDKDGKTGPRATKTLACKYGEDKVVFIKGDVRTDLERVYDEVLEKYGCVDILVNNAGIISETDPRGTVNTNTVAVMEWSIKYKNLMRRDMVSQCGKGGVIINIASIAGHLDSPFTPSYVASKYAVVGFSRTLGHPYNQRQTGVDVLAICPGFTHTNITRNLKVVEDFQQEDFERVLGSIPSQEADAVGSGVVQVYKDAGTGTVWDIVGGKVYKAPPITVIPL